MLTDPTPEAIADILNRVRTIAVVGASADRAKASNRVLRFLAEAGYDVIPVNPRAETGEIEGLRVFPTLDAIDRPVDMVDVFRPSRELSDIADQAIGIGAKVLWAQLGITDAHAAQRAEEAGLTVVMDRCPKIELARPAVKRHLTRTI